MGINEKVLFIQEIIKLRFGIVIYFSIDFQNFCVNLLYDRDCFGKITIANMMRMESELLVSMIIAKLSIRIGS